MKITFIPQRRNDRLAISVDFDQITINEDVFDFSELPEGATLPQHAVDCAWLASDVERHSGDVHLSLLLPHGSNAPQNTRFPVAVDQQQGEVDIPAYSTNETIDKDA